jgi:hypothetical protein
MFALSITDNNFRASVLPSFTFWQECFSMATLKKLSAASVTATFIALGTCDTAPAQAMLLNFQFAFNDQASGELISGNFVFDDDVPDFFGNEPNLGVYGDAAQSFTINAGTNGLFQGAGLTVVVANDSPSDFGLTDVIIFDEFLSVNPENPLAIFAYTPQALSNDVIPTAVPSSAVAILNLPTGVTLTSFNASTSITPVVSASVPESTSTLGLLTLAAFGSGSWLLRQHKRFISGLTQRR